MNEIQLPVMSFDIDAMMPDVPYREVKKLIAEVARLRALIKDAEWRGGDVTGDTMCPWCEAYKFNYDGHPGGTHANDCPAFTPEGEVR